MTKTEQLVQEAQVLTGDQIDGLIAYARYLRSGPLHATAPADALASIEAGLGDAKAGRVTAAEAVFARIDQKLASRKA